jgi:hypothetical protein
MRTIEDRIFSFFGLESEAEIAARKARASEAARRSECERLFGELRMNYWPTQAECDEFYGNPRGSSGAQASGAWERNNLEYIAPAYPLHMGDIPITAIRIHRKCADSLKRVMAYLAVADQPGKNEFGGSYVYRMMRANSRSLSMHAYGVAIDFDPEHNGFGAKAHRFTDESPIVLAFKAEGWTWGGDWVYPDAMHFQAASVR